ncbi:uncharacterized protein CC84DRAFT_1180595 [Paraphaeosphaeria sporulosa]|uniref:Uncharacterized protein n=1 Tax=Paraphaeosphaeria sporulosa TaxID=1460663 RepID=A0A177C033_9PLEO|nr:uncharacterized protein CC84DRAFT_1180595 [Paraphaeosphaeria sporulosa]OAG00601.1 hypothetical protein CC84DRAFT_1180595 [Paraphaeosphaeria sporulosa]
MGAPSPVSQNQSTSPHIHEHGRTEPTVPNLDRYVLIHDCLQPAKQHQTGLFLNLASLEWLRPQPRIFHVVTSKRPSRDLGLLLRRVLRRLQDLGDGLVQASRFERRWPRGRSPSPRSTNPCSMTNRAPPLVDGTRPLQSNEITAFGVTRLAAGDAILGIEQPVKGLEGDTKKEFT